MKTIKTFEDACKAEGLKSEQALPDVSTISPADQEPIIAYSKLLIIARALNRTANGGEEWKPDWNNYDEYKYYPWFEMGGSSGFRFNDYDYWRTRSGVGSRLCFKTRELAEYAGKEFIDLYNLLMTIK